MVNSFVRPSCDIAPSCGGNQPHLVTTATTMPSVRAQLKWLTRLKDEEEESSSDSEVSDSSVSSDGRDEALAAKRRATAATGRETAGVVKRTSSAAKKTGEDESDEAMRAEQLVYARSERLQVAAAMKASKEVGNGVQAEGNGGKKGGKAEKPAPEKKRKRPTEAEKKKKDEAVRRVSLEQAEAVEDEPASAEKPQRRPREAKIEVSVVKTVEDAVVANGDAHVHKERKHWKTAKSRRRASEDAAAATKAVEATNGEVQHPHVDEEKKPKKTEKPRRRPSEDASVVRAINVANGNAEPSRVEEVKKLKKVERKKASRGDVEPAAKTKEMVSKKVLSKRKNLISDSSEGESDGEANGERVRKQSTEEAEVAPRKRLKRPLPSKAVEIEDPAESSANVKKEVVVKRPGTKTKINELESKPARDALDGHPMKKLKRPIEKQVASLDDFLKEEEVKKSKKCSLKPSENGDAKENDDFKPEKGEDVLEGPTIGDASPLPTNDVTQPDPKFVQVAGVDPESAVVEGVAGTSSAQKNENGPDDVRSSGTIPTTSVAVNGRVEALRKVSVAEESEEGAVSEDESATQETKPQKSDAETNGSGKPVDPMSFIIPKKRGGEKQITSSSQPTASLRDRRGAPQLNGVKPGPMPAPSPSPASDGGYDVSFPDPAQQHRKPRTKNPVPPRMPPLTQSERDFMRLAKKANSIFKACSLTASGIGASGVKPHLVSAFGSTTQRYGVLDSSGSLYQEQTTMMKCVTRKAMKKAQHPPSFYGQLMEPPPCSRPSGDAEQTAEVQETRDSPSLQENAQASADQQSAQIPCYEKLEFERAQDRDWYQCRLYGTYFVPQLLRGRTTLVMLNAKYVRKSTGILFNSNRDKEDFAASISERYTVNRTIPRCDIPQKNWQQLVNGHVTFLFLHYQNREDATSARRRFVDDLGRPLQLKGDKSGFDVGRAPMRSPTPPDAPAPRRSRSSERGRERSPPRRHDLEHDRRIPNGDMNGGRPQRDIHGGHQDRRGSFDRREAFQDRDTDRYRSRYGEPGPSGFNRDGGGRSPPYRGRPRSRSRSRPRHQDGPSDHSHYSADNRMRRDEESGEVHPSREGHSKLSSQDSEEHSKSLREKGDRDSSEQYHRGNGAERGQEEDPRHRRSRSRSRPRGYAGPPPDRHEERGRHHDRYPRNGGEYENARRGSQDYGYDDRIRGGRDGHHRRHRHHGRRPY